ncbi:hypothetical protein C0389_09645, partial [bacterium]|nr:hypothetical protein [bacterium]
DGFPSNALVLNGKRQPMNGNSFAAPIISGIASLFIQKYGKLSLHDARRLLKRFSTDGRIPT